MAEASKGVAESSFARELKAGIKAKFDPDPQDLEKLVKKHGEKLVGTVGSDSVVIESKEDPTKVLAFDYYHATTSVEAKSLFYRHQIMNILFPHNFPKIFSSHGTDQRGKEITGTARERIESGSQVNPEYSWDKVVAVKEELDLPIMFDQVGANLKIGPDGGEYYLDRIDRYVPLIWEPPTKDWNKEAIDKYMEEKGYNPKQITIVNQAIDRLVYLKNSQVNNKKEPQPSVESPASFSNDPPKNSV